MRSQDYSFCLIFIPFILPAPASANALLMGFFYPLCNLFRQFSLYAFNVECVMYLSYWMVLRCEQRVKIPKAKLRKISCHLPEAHLCPYFSSPVYCLADKMPLSSGNIWYRAYNVISAEPLALK